jgi:eukaryotic-like serine/threonine-protein kinase
MSTEDRIRDLLDEFDARTTPEEVCADDPELLPEVRARWEKLRRLQGRIDEIFAADDDPTIHEGRTPIPARPNPDEPLPLIDGYEVESVLGRGGMGVVFKARHLRLNRHVAIKMMLAGPYAAASDLTRFRREAEAVAALRHPNIVQIHDVGDISGRHYFTMEHLEGGGLGHRLANKPMPVRAAAEMSATLAAAVQFAHKVGFIHRDLKPANILFDGDGIPKIADFGLARSITEGGRVTLTGTRMGTPCYMAPEQALGAASAIGPAADVYALGAILYEMLTGRPPFDGDSPLEIERRVIGDEPAPPSRINAVVPRDLETICLKCLQKNPARRYASAQDLADDLHRFLDGKPVTARPIGVIERAVKWARRRPAQAVLIVSSLVVLAAAVGAGSWLNEERSSRRSVARRVIERGIPRAYELSREEKWEDARRLLVNAEQNAVYAESDELSRRIERARQQIGFAGQLEKIRESQTFFQPIDREGIRVANDERASEYASAFAEAKIDLDDPDSAAAKIRDSEVRLQIVAALDLWAMAAFKNKRYPEHRKLLAIARAADPGCAWQDRFRDPATWIRKNALVQLSEEALDAERPAHQLAIVGQLLRGFDANKDCTRLLHDALMRQPGNYWLNWEMGLALDGDNRFRESVRHFAVAVAVRPEDPWRLYRLAGALSSSGQHEEAIAMGRRAVELAPSTWVLRHNLAVDYLHTGQTEKAADECRRILEKDPKNAHALAALGATLGASRRPDDAIRLYRQVVALQPDHLNAWYNMANDLTNLKRDAEAANAYAKAISISPSHFPARVGLARASVATRDHRTAAAQFRWILDALKRDKQKKTLTRFDIDLKGVFFEASCYLSESLCVFGKFAEARDVAQRGLDRKPPENEKAILTRRLNLAQKLVPVESRVAAILANQETPDDAEVHLALAEWLRKDRKLTAAASRFYESAFVRKPSLAENIDAANRLWAACADAQAGCGIGDDADAIDGDEKKKLRRRALQRLTAERDGWAKRLEVGTMPEQTQAAGEFRFWQKYTDLECLRESSALAKLSVAEAAEWRRFWTDVDALAKQDPAMRLTQARELVRRRQWAEAAELYARLIDKSRPDNGEIWFECAAAQFLANDRDGYRRTCERTRELVSKTPRMRRYLVARAVTLTSDSAESAARVEAESAKELQNFGSRSFSLTERGAFSLRGGRLKEAIDFFEQSLRADSRSGAVELNRLWLAIAHARRNEPEEANRLLDAATAWLNSIGNELPENSEASLGVHRHDWMEAHVLRHEAEDLLAGKSKK